MDYKMVNMLILAVIPAIVTSITITSNGNSPEVKMVGGIMVDMQKGFVPMVPKFEESTVRNRIGTEKKLNVNSTKLAINERYRRLIPYMTFYYANDLATPTTATYKDVEVEKAEIFEAKELDETNQREPKKIIYTHHRNIPRYQGNRLTHHNIASANPTKIFYKTPISYQIPIKASQNYNPSLSEYRVVLGNDYDTGRFTPKPPPQTQFVYTSPTRKPFYNFYNEESPNIRYYLSEKDQSPKYKLVPYEQTPPHKVPENDNVYDITKKPVPVSVLIPKEQVYLKPRPARPHYVYETVNVQQPIRKQPAIISESYFEKRPPTLSEQPIVHGGFKPLFHAPLDTESVYTTGIPEHTDIGSNIDHNNRQNAQIETAPLIRDDDFKPNYYEYVVEPTTTYKPPRVTPSNTLSLASLLNSLQLNKSIPKPVTKENVGSSIHTLLQVLNVLKAVPQSDTVEVPVLSSPKPFVASKVVADLTAKPVVAPATESPIPTRDDEDLPEQPYLAEVNIPSQYLDDTPSDGGSSQRFPLQVTSDDEGGTPGQPGVDYPILSIIPPTKFNCKTQRYKGFFADPETRCQVWHYCDLNGGQASFLCPNGTIFSQAALTCDWWHNVRCASTTQLYVLNESLYKYILPHSPKFPEDYSGPLVDKYLTLKFKEMEEEFRKKKNKHAASEKMDDVSTEASEEKEDSGEESEKDTANDKSDTAVSEPSVLVESPGTSGQVERLSDE